MGTGSAPYSEGFPLSLFLIHLLFYFFLRCCDRFDLSLLAVYSAASPSDSGHLAPWMRWHPRVQTPFENWEGQQATFALSLHIQPVFLGALLG